MGALGRKRVLAVGPLRRSDDARATWQAFCGAGNSILLTTIIAGAIRQTGTIGQMQERDCKYCDPGC